MPDPTVLEKNIKAVNDIITFVQANDLTPEHLDELVHDVASLNASTCNNGGLHEQIPFLVTNLGPEEAMKAVKGLVKPKKSFTEADLPPPEKA